MTAATDPLATRALRPDDAAAAVALSSEAGWNQTVADWHFMLAAGEARGQLTAAGALVASAVILPFGEKIAWIGMVLTTESHRRRGLATENLRWAIERAITVIPKSVHENRIRENAGVFDFQLGAEDLARLDGLDRTGGAAIAVENPWWTLPARARAAGRRLLRSARPS